MRISRASIAVLCSSEETMNESGKFPRRDFLKGATLLAGAPALMAQRNPSDRIGVACLGVGTRGHQLLTDAQSVPNSEVRVICDLYEGNVKRALGLCKNPNVRVVHEWEKALADPDIDVVLIAT